jgi:hypothetical protein
MYIKLPIAPYKYYAQERAISKLVQRAYFYLESCTDFKCIKSLSALLSVNSMRSIHF